MLDQTTVESAILKWLEDFVEKPHPNLGNWSPCPFARQARLNKTYKIIQGTDVLSDGIDLASNWDDSKEVIILWYNSVTVADLSTAMAELNQRIMPEDLVALEGHPELEESINGVDMRFELCPIVVYQRLDKLNQAAEQLKNKGYYKHWNQAELDNIVTWRYSK